MLKQSPGNNIDKTCGMKNFEQNFFGIFFNERKNLKKLTIFLYSLLTF